MTFNGFISYSHAADGRLAPAIQRGLQHLARPWHRRRALWIFRDETGLAVTPTLWAAIQDALSKSEYFVLLASPAAAQSPWVNREIAHWVATKPASRILPVVTDGEWSWDAERGDFTPESTAVPQALRGVFTEEPLYLDLRWATDSSQLTLQHTRFRSAIAQLAAPMHGISKDDLDSEDVRQHRRLRRLRAVAVGGLLALAGVAGVAGLLAAHNADRANVATAESQHQQQVADQQRGSAERATAQARREQRLAERQRRSAQRSALDARRSRGQAEVEQRRARIAAAETRYQQQLTQQQQQLAAKAATEAKRQQSRARDQQTIADRATARATHQQLLAEQAAAEAARQQKLAQQQKKLAEAAAKDAELQKKLAQQQKGVAIGRRTFNQAKLLVDGAPQTALMLGVAAQHIEGDTEAKAQLVGLMTRTRYQATIGKSTAAIAGPHNLLVTCHANIRVDLWDIAVPTAPARLASLDNACTGADSLSLSKDGTRVSCADGVGVTVWDISNRRNPVKKARVAAGIPMQMASISPDGKSLATLPLDGGPPVLWDISDGDNPQRVAEIPHQGDFVLKVTFSPDAKTLVVMADEISIVDIGDRHHLRRLADLPMFFDDFALNRDGTALATVMEDSVQLWDLHDRTHPVQSATLAIPSMGFLHVAFSPDGKSLAAGGALGEIGLWDLSDVSNPIRVDEGFSQGPVWVAFGSEANVIISGGLNKPVALWALRDHRGAPVARARLFNDNGGNGDFAAYSDDNRTLTLAGADGRFSYWDVSDPSRPIRQAGAVKLEVRRVLNLSADGRFVSVLDRSNCTKIWDLSDREHPVNRASFCKISTPEVAFGSDRRTVAVAASEDGVALYELGAGSAAPVKVASLPGSAGHVGAMAFSRDGRTLAFGKEDHTVELWDVTDRTHLHRITVLTGHVSAVRSLSFTSDGATLAVGDGQVVTLWQIADLHEPMRISTISRPYLSTGTLVVSADQASMAVGGRDSSGKYFVELWDLSEFNALRSDPVGLACASTGRGLTREEWARYLPDVDYRPTCEKPQ